MPDHADEPSRLDTEIELLEAMYPGQIHYNSKSREFKFASEKNHASLRVRLPETYPDQGSPDVILATNASRSDIRAITSNAVTQLALPDGEEALDAIIAAFQNILQNATAIQECDIDSRTGTRDGANTPKTVIIWLHHLLNTNKRKLALSPTALSGLTKPGYPGVLIYSGPSQAVDEHVTLLKAQNWQAFSVRLEQEEMWAFAHGTGVREVETMAQVAKGVEAIDDGSIGERGRRQKDEFLKAVGIK
ncbi:hypothetical protein ACN47E_006339 [Coniothyrium glycines]